MLKAFKIINNRLNWMSIGAILAAFVIIWIEDDKNKKIKPYEPSDKFMDIYNHYNNKEKSNA